MWWQFRKPKASLTVEAALTVPIFLYAILAFLYLFQILYVQQTVQTALHETANFYAKNASVYQELMDEFDLGETEQLETILSTLQIGKRITNLVFAQKFKSFLSEKALGGVVQEGLSGLQVYQIADYSEDDVVDLCVYYECQIPVLFFEIDPMTCVQRVHVKNWTGVEVAKRYGEAETADEEESSGETVYITETGTKYHTHADCTYLQLSIQQSLYGKLSTLKNKYGQSYTPCLLCAKGQELSAGSVIYITSEGNRYHTQEKCSGLKRTIKEIDISQLPAGMTLCSRCSKRDAKEKAEAATEE